MAKHNVPMDLMKVTRNVASRNTRSMMMLDVAVVRTNSNVPTRNALANLKCAMVLPNVQMDLMKVELSAALTSISSTTLRSVAATQILNLHALMATVSLTQDSVMVKLNVAINLMNNTPQPRSISRLPPLTRTPFLILLP
jgi:hypothetical protein